MPLPRPAAGEGRAAEGLSSTVTSAGALWLEPSSRRSSAADDFVMDDEVVLAECDQPFVLHPSELPGQGRPVDVQIVGQLLASSSFFLNVIFRIFFYFYFTKFTVGLQSFNVFIYTVS